jgi:hypothetical protein
MNSVLHCAILLGLGAGFFGRWSGFKIHSWWRQPTSVSQIIGRTIELSRAESNSEFFSEYKCLLGILLQLSTVKIVVSLVAIGPLIVAFLCLGKLANSLRPAEQGYISINAAQPFELQYAAGIYGIDQTHPIFAIAEGESRQASVGLRTTPLVFIELDEKVGFSTSAVARLSMLLLGFNAPHFVSGTPDHLEQLLYRPFDKDVNPCWPWLNDVEFTFTVAAVGGSLAAPLFIRRRT